MSQMSYVLVLCFNIVNNLLSNWDALKMEGGASNT